MQPCKEFRCPAFRVAVGAEGIQIDGIELSSRQFIADGITQMQGQCDVPVQCQRERWPGIPVTIMEVCRGVQSCNQLVVQPGILQLFAVMHRWQQCQDGRIVFDGVVCQRRLAVAGKICCQQAIEAKPEADFQHTSGLPGGKALSDTRGVQEYVSGFGDGAIDGVESLSITLTVKCVGAIGRTDSSHR